MSILKHLTAILQGGREMLSPTCREAARLQSAARDGKLSRGQRFGLKIHLFFCKWCRRYGRQLRFMRETIRSEPVKLGEATRSSLSAQARERIKRSLSDHRNQ